MQEMWRVNTHARYVENKTCSAIGVHACYINIYKHFLQFN